MDFVIGLGGVVAGVLEDDWLLSITCKVTNVTDEGWECLLPIPPGCSGAKFVRSHTWPSTTIQRSLAVLCLLISSVESIFGSAIVECDGGNGNSRMTETEVRILHLSGPLGGDTKRFGRNQSYVLLVASVCLETYSAGDSPGHSAERMRYVSG